ncbi:uncharacterized protein BKCO1_5400069 [Diplodia corticola]|uniref:Uncharacterized protein n=1 Tax=Diplodia corticola TaxID=236234 RepID=A0A1J9QR41_9PEZI|nr:uncharacterized protein BKCO1_5400069 [Diplodia corticola]OJD30881.1 hypothetical protein BKCO1_5400069 [Diplodia corticola]
MDIRPDADDGGAHSVDIDVHPPEAPPIAAARPSSSVTTTGSLATLYGLAVWGVDGVPKEELVRDEQRLLRKAETVYAQFLAQPLNEMRE